MQRHLNLVKSDFELLEKKVLPRFPFCFLTFKSSKNQNLVFEVKDISNSGMQLGLKLGDHQLDKDHTIHGLMHWGKRELEVSGTIKWITPLRVGVEFSHSTSQKHAVEDFLEMSQVAKELKPVHKMDSGVDIPVKLKYWLRADGPVELFIWQHNDGEYERFQVLMMENFIEWEDGKGIKTARVLSKRDIDTPLITEDEYVFKIDEHIDNEKVLKATNLVLNLESQQLDESVVNFILRKLKNS